MDKFIWNGRPASELSREDLLEVIAHMVAEMDAHRQSQAQMDQLDSLTWNPPAGQFARVVRRWIKPPA